MLKTTFKPGDMVEWRHEEVPFLRRFGVGPFKVAKVLPAESPISHSQDVLLEGWDDIYANWFNGWWFRRVSGRPKS